MGPSIKKRLDIFSDGEILVTGGAGFIGSHIIDRLMEDRCSVILLDNLSTGTISHIQKYLDNPRFKFIRSDLGEIEAFSDMLAGVKTVFHIAAYPEVRSGYHHPEIAYEQNITKTFFLLEHLRKRSQMNNLYFTSTSTVYGDAKKIPTPEDYGPLLPISPYGASKLACEALISSYCHNYGFQGQIFRLANVIGSRSSHGVIWDLISKITDTTNNRIEILGDGTQSKSYIHISDCIDCIFYCIAKQKECVEVFNIGTEDTVDVISIARLAAKVLGYNSIELTRKNMEKDGRGWKGDVKQMQLDIARVRAMGWKPTMNSEKAVLMAIKEICQEQNCHASGQL